MTQSPKDDALRAARAAITAMLGRYDQDQWECEIECHTQAKYAVALIDAVMAPAPADVKLRLALNHQSASDDGSENGAIAALPRADEERRGPAQGEAPHFVDQSPCQREAGSQPRSITVWNRSPDGEAGWKLWRTLDAKYAEGDPGWLMTIPIDAALASSPPRQPQQ